MDQYLAKEWQEIQIEAIKTLRKGFHCNVSHKWDRKYQFIKEPTFENPISWEIFEVNDNKNSLCARLEWDKSNDIEIFQSPVHRMKHLGKVTPTLKSEGKEFGKELKNLINRFNSLELSVCSNERVIGLDCTVFEVIVIEKMTKVSYQWWENGTENWKELDLIAREIIDYLESQF